MIYLLVTLCIIGMLLSYPLIYHAFIYPKEMEEFHGLMKKGRGDRALTILQRLPARKKNTLDVQLAFSEAQAAANHPYLAIFHLGEILEKKLAKPPPSTASGSQVDIHLRKAAIYEELRQGKKAMEEYFRIVKIAPKHTLSNQKIGVELFRLKNYSAALEYLKVAHHALPDDAKLAETIADAYTARKQFGPALEAIRQAIATSSPVHCRLQHKESLSLYRLGKFREALSVAEEIDGSYRDTHEVSWLRGLLHVQLHHTREAYTIFEKNLDHYINNYSPMLLEARYAYSELLLMDYDISGALAQLDFIARKHETYQDSEKRIALYSQIAKSPAWERFLALWKEPQNSSEPRNPKQTRQAAEANKQTRAIERFAAITKTLATSTWSLMPTAPVVTKDLATEPINDISTSRHAIQRLIFRPLPKSLMYIMRAFTHEMNTPSLNRRPALLLLNLDFKPLRTAHIEAILATRQSLEAKDEQTYTTLIILSLFPLPQTTQATFSRNFTQVEIISEEKLLHFIDPQKITTSNPLADKASVQTTVTA